MRTWLTPGALVLCVCAACGESEAKREEAAMRAAIPQRLRPDGTVALTDADRAALGLAIEPAVNLALPEMHTRFGVVRPRLAEDALVVAPVAGKVASASTVALGARVIAGQPVVTIDPILGTSEQLSARVQGADLAGQIAAAQQELTAGEAELQRVLVLEKDKIVSTATLQQTEAAVAGTRARLSALRRARTVQGAGAGGRIALRSPTDGTVVALDAALGAVVGPGDVLVRILTPGPLWVEVQMPPDEPPGDRYEVATGTAWVPARLVARGALVGAEGTRTDRLEVATADAAALLPGATVEVRVGHGTTPRVVVPETAIVPAAGADVVYVETAEGLFVPRPVRVVARSDSKAGVTGVTAGDRVVVTGAMSLRGESLRAELRHTE